MYVYCNKLTIRYKHKALYGRTVFISVFQIGSSGKTGGERGGSIYSLDGINTCRTALTAASRFVNVTNA